MKTVAILDLGTNTFNLLVAGIHTDGSHKVLVRTREVVKLLEGSGGTGTIGQSAMNRACDAVKNHLKKAGNFNLDKVIAFGTAALRDSVNASDLIEKIESENGIRVTVISGEMEACYIHEGVKSALNIGERPSLIVDIGGGSNELILCRNQEIFSAQSFGCGAGKSMEIFDMEDPPALHEIKKLEQWYDEMLEPFWPNAAKYIPEVLIGSSGSFDTLADMHSYRMGHEKGWTEGTEYDLPVMDYREIGAFLLASNREARLAAPGMLEMRVDLIVAGIIFIDLLLKKTGIKKIRVSAGALKEGVLANEIRQLT